MEFLHEVTKKDDRGTHLFRKGMVVFFEVFP